MKTKMMMIVTILISTLFQGCGTLCSDAKDTARCQAESMERSRMMAFERMDHGSRGDR